MNVRRFVGKNAREAMAQVRAAWGDEAVVLSNRPIPGGVEILAMAGNEVPMQPVTVSAPPAGARRAAAAGPVAPMSTVSFQEFVRERQRQDAQAEAIAVAAPVAASHRAPPVEPARFAAQALQEEMARPAAPAVPVAAPRAAEPARVAHRAAEVTRTFAAVEQAGQGEELMAELKSMRGLIAGQLASLSWFDGVRRSPAQTQLLRLMIDNGFSPALARKLVHHLPAERAHDASEAGQWLLEILSHNLQCAPESQALVERGGVYAVVGPTGVGKTTTTAKLAATFAMKHGPASVGLITVDTYRMAASDQLRAFGKILNIPVHTAADSATLTDLLDLFTNKKLVLIDTVGVGQRDKRLAELIGSLPGRVSRLMVLNASAQAEALEEVVQAYGARPGSRCVITKLDEAVKCGAVMDVAIRHRLQVEGICNGQRVPEDWHAARPQLLVQKALLRQPPSVFTPDDDELGLLLTAPPAATRGTAGAIGMRALRA